MRLISIIAAATMATAGVAVAATSADFKTVDADGNGQISWTEGKAVHPEWTQEAFDSLDKDKSGSLSMEEYQAASTDKKKKM